MKSIPALWDIIARSANSILGKNQNMRSADISLSLKEVGLFLALIVACLLMYLVAIPLAAVFASLYVLVAWLLDAVRWVAVRFQRA